MKNKSGITLIALIITIIVMLILVAVSVQILVKSDLIGTAEKTGEAYKIAHEEEQNLNDLTINGKKLDEYKQKLEGNGEGNPPTGDPEVDPPTEEAEPIPAGGTYTAADGTVYEAGENFPTLTTGDIYIYGDYEYRYNAYCEAWDGNDYWSVSAQGGWGVRAIEGDKAEYGEILTTINGANVTNMTGTFLGCSSLVTSPEIPESVTSLYRTFEGCESLRTAPEIPEGIVDMTLTFRSCRSLSGTIIIDANPGAYDGCFSGICPICQLIEVDGDTTMGEQLLAATTALNWYAGMTGSMPIGCDHFE